MFPLQHRPLALREASLPPACSPPPARNQCRSRRSRQRDQKRCVGVLSQYAFSLTVPRVLVQTHYRSGSFKSRSSRPYSETSSPMGQSQSARTVRCTIPFQPRKLILTITRTDLIAAIVSSPGFARISQLAIQGIVETVRFYYHSDHPNLTHIVSAS